MSDVTDHDARVRRCPRLGHDLRFAYCRAPGQALPCRRVFDCWFEIFDVAGFMREHFSEKQIEQITAPPREKMLSLVELIQQARQRNAEGDRDR